jgi:hypothetical protein
VFLSLRFLVETLGTDGDLVKLFEDAFKQQPDNDELGRQAFFANVRAGNWKAAQLVRISPLRRPTATSCERIVALFVFLCFETASLN